MLRSLFVVVLMTVGVVFALQSAYFSLLFYLWIAYFRPQEWVWSGTIQSLNLSLYTGIYLIGITIVSLPRLQLNLRTLLLALVLVQATISLLASPHFDFAWTYWQDFVKTITITYLIVILVTDRHKLRLAFVVIALSLSFEPAKQAWAQVFLAPGQKNYNSIGFLGDESGVGVGMLMLLPILLLLAKTAARRWEQWVFRLLAIGILYRAISTYSRGAFLGGVVLAGVYFLRSRHKVRTVVMAVAVVAIIASVLPSKFWDRMGTITADTNQMDQSSAGRVYFWTIGMQMASDHPLTGVGPNAFAKEYSKYDKTLYEYGQDRSVHSTWFGILSELGYPGLILLLLSLIGVFLACRRVRRMARDHVELRVLGDYAAALETSFAAFAVAGSFIIFQYVEMLWHFVGFSIALLAIAQAECSALESVAQPTLLRASPGSRPRTLSPAVSSVAATTRLERGGPRLGRDR